MKEWETKAHHQTQTVGRRKAKKTHNTMEAAGMTTNIPPTIMATLTKNQMMINITGHHGIKISIQSSMIDWMSLKHFKLLSSPPYLFYFQFVI